MANEEISHIELIQELLVRFDGEITSCREALSHYEKEVIELRNGMLEGEMANQPWASAKQV